MPVGWYLVWAPLPDRPALRPVQSLRIRRDRRRPHLPSRLWWPEIEVPPD